METIQVSRLMRFTWLISFSNYTSNYSKTRLSPIIFRWWLFSRHFASVFSRHFAFCISTFSQLSLSINLQSNSIEEQSSEDLWNKMTVLLWFKNGHARNQAWDLYPASRLFYYWSTCLFHDLEMCGFLHPTNSTYHARNSILIWFRH